MKSICRRTMSQRLGIVDQTIPTGDAAFRALLPIERIKDRNLRAFVSTEVSTRWIGRGGHIQAYPIRNSTLYNMVCCGISTQVAEMVNCVAGYGSPGYRLHGGIMDHTSIQSPDIGALRGLGRQPARKTHRADPRRQYHGMATLPARSSSHLDAW